MYTTKVTYLKKEKQYGCRIFRTLEDNTTTLIIEGRCNSRHLIGATFRDLLRTIDKSGSGDKFTHAARMRNNKLSNILHHTIHYWNGKINKKWNQYVDIPP